MDFLDNDSYLSWSDREIKVVLNSWLKRETNDKIAAFFKYTSSGIDVPFEASPASGFFRVLVDKLNAIDERGFVTPFGWSKEPIDINYGLVNASFSDVIIPTPVLANESSSIKFYLGPEIVQNTDAVEIIKQVFEDLNCAVAANLILDTTGTIEPIDATLPLSERYNTNVIEFGDLDGQIVGEVFRQQQQQCPSFLSSGYTLYTTIIIDPAKATDFSTVVDVAIEDKSSFYNVFTHELGHALGLTHVSEYTNEGVSSGSFENGIDPLRGVSRMMGTRVQQTGQPIRDIFEPTFIDGLTTALTLSSSLDVANFTCFMPNEISTFTFDSRGNELNGCGLNGLYNKEKESLISIYPNPSDGSFELDTKEYVIDHVLVYNLQGILIKSLTDDIKEEIDLSFLDKGIYLLNIYEKDNLLFNEKISIY